MKKQETIRAFIDASQIVIQCAMCSTPRTGSPWGPVSLAEGLWKEGWRVQDWELDDASGEGAVLCQYCKDGQR